MDLRPDTQTDAQLIELAQSRSPDATEAFEKLYRRHRDWVVRAARRLTPDDQAALDAAHDAFLGLMRRLSVPPPLKLRSRLTTYLYPAVRHAAARAAKKRTLPRDLPVAGPSADHEPAASGSLRAALDRLPPAQREVLVLHTVEGLTLEEVALAMQTPVGTAKSRLHKALQRLRADESLRELFEP